MFKRTIKKLSITRQTLKNLQLGAVVGAMVNRTVSVPVEDCVSTHQGCNKTYTCPIGP